MMMDDHDAHTSKKSKSSDIFSFRSIIMMVGCIGAATSMYVLKNATLRHEADMIGKMR
jgi:phosphotransferase system  glucose/maltose/N-acetylglucosamine-specific IIC component